VALKSSRLRLIIGLCSETYFAYLNIDTETTSMKEKRNLSFLGWISLAVRPLIFTLLILSLAACRQAPAAAPAVESTATAAAPVVPTATQPEPPTATAAAVAAATATTLPSPTPTQPPSPTPEPTLAPTATPVPTLALTENGFNAWCASEAYLGTRPTSPDAPQNANTVEVKSEVLTLKIPAAYCVVTFKFNQAAPEGLALTFSDARVPFMKLPLKAVEGHPEQVWVSFNHQYVVNPPKWSALYNLEVTGADGKSLWSNNVRFARPQPEGCQFGGLPDPVTLYCTHSDPGEVEPRSPKYTPFPPNEDR
jgi:hypothetical protein